MLKSKREIPCFYLTVKADVTDLVKLRTKLNETSDVKISYNDFIMKAVAMGLEKFPIMTGQLAGDAIKLADAIHIGLAISVPDGLVAPVVKDVNKKDVTQIARDSQALIERARSNKLSPDRLGRRLHHRKQPRRLRDRFVHSDCCAGPVQHFGIGQITDTCVPDNGNISSASYEYDAVGGPQGHQRRLRSAVSGLCQETVGRYNRRLAWGPES